MQVDPEIPWTADSLTENRLKTPQPDLVIQFQFEESYNFQIEETHMARPEGTHSRTVQFPEIPRNKVRICRRPENHWSKIQEYWRDVRADEGSRIQSGSPGRVG